MSALDGAKRLLALVDGGDPHRPLKRQRPKNPIPKRRELCAGEFWISPKDGFPKGCPEGMIRRADVKCLCNGAFLQKFIKESDPNTNDGLVPIESVFGDGTCQVIDGEFRFTPQMSLAKFLEGLALRSPQHIKEMLMGKRASAYGLVGGIHGNAGEISVTDTLRAQFEAVTIQNAAFRAQFEAVTIQNAAFRAQNDTQKVELVAAAEESEAMKAKNGALEFELATMKRAYASLEQRSFKGRPYTFSSVGTRY